jgi:tetratricopeptide (TPR) repeat protein
MPHPPISPKHKLPMPVQSVPQQNQVGFLMAQGLTLHQQGKFNEAKAIYEKVLAIEINHFDALMFLGTLSAQTKEFTKAVDALTTALKINPNHAVCYSNRGNALKELKRLDEALASYDKAISIKPDFAGAHSNRGNVLTELTHLDEALASYDKAISIKPDYAEAFYNRGNVLTELKRLDEALASYDKAISIKPDYAEAFYNRGNALKVLTRLDEALASYDKAISIKSDYAEAYSNRGNTLKVLKRLDEALASYNKAISIKPDYAEAYWNLSLCHLLRGNFKDGWQGYEWRWKRKDISKTAGIRNFPQPLWLGEQSLKDKTILLYAEQGLGDTIQFCRYVPIVEKLGAKVILEVSRPLVKLLKNLEGVNQIIAQGDTLPKFDFQCPLLSLPLAFKTSLNTIPSASQNITRDAENVTKWQTKLGEKSKRRVGLVWSSVSSFKNDHVRSITLLELLSALPKEGFEYICLQKEIKEIDKDTLKANPQIKFFGDSLNDFTDTAELIECLDLVISTCTSVPHLSCSMGKETWLMLSYVPDWRWLLDRKDNPWYPSAKLYRQEKIGNWHGVLEKVKSDLERLVNEIK